MILNNFPPGINAKLMQLYSGGIAQPSEEDCDPQQLDHGVVIVAFGEGDAPSDPQTVKKELMRGYKMRAKGLMKSLPEPVVGGEKVGVGEFGGLGDLCSDFWIVDCFWDFYFCMVFFLHFFYHKDILYPKIFPKKPSRSNSGPSETPGALCGVKTVTIVLPGELVLAVSTNS